MAGYISVIEIGQSKIQKYIEQQREIKKNEIFTIQCITYFQLYFWFYAQNPKGLNQ
jgi:hypothetical protein